MTDVFNDFGVNIMSGGTPLVRADIELLMKHRINYVDILPRQMETDRPNSWKTAHVESHVLPTYMKTISSVKKIFDSIQNGEQLLTKDLDDFTKSMISSIQEERDAVSLLILLNTDEEYTYQHSVHVGMLAYFISKWLGYPEEEAQLIGRTGFLHDIGKSKVPAHILNKPAALTEEEFEEIKKHTNYGHDIIIQAQGPCVEAAVALQHHERIDGSGYPNGLTGEQIHPYAKIVAVADTYSAMISKRIYKQSKDLLCVLKELYQLSFKNLEPKVVHTFIEHMLPSFIGKVAVLNNDQQGEIVMINPNDLFRPLIKMKAKFVDLSEHKNLEIVRIMV
ncbi:HD-GYP domain-containing protein [Marinicrinis lubricantis]